MVYSKPDDVLKPQPARIVETGDGREVRTPRRNHLLGVFNDKNQLVIKRGDELVIVEVPKA
ncbi:MAG: hypothetical protein A2W26_13610 [Acidobacteria bacterium RBG_16_64_8]|nr:MAG: hypothetical protein A2W26_13610 [Acidobacteria bacterium RBG_16_64_8]